MRGVLNIESMKIEAGSELGILGWFTSHRTVTAERARTRVTALGTGSADSRRCGCCAVRLLLVEGLSYHRFCFRGPWL